jgi:hypothetical protein
VPREALNVRTGCRPRRQRCLAKPAERARDYEARGSGRGTSGGSGSGVSGEGAGAGGKVGSGGVGGKVGSGGVGGNVGSGVGTSPSGLPSI